jgi:glycosyltransferase involved in cell wall biosynthesis
MNIDLKAKLEIKDDQLDDFFLFVNQGKISETVMDWFLHQIGKESLDTYHIIKSDIKQNESEDLHEPLVSIIIPTYNRRKMLEESLDSIFIQSYKNIEILIINDHSNDDTDSFLKDLSLKVQNVLIFTNETNLNAGYNRYYGYQHAHGKYIIFMDDDDYYIDPMFISKGVMKLENKESLNFVSANSFVQNINTNKLEFHALNIKGLIRSNDYFSGFQTHYQKPLSTFTSIFRKSILDDLGFRSMRMMNDVSIYLRALLSGEVDVMEDIIGVYRIHSSNLTQHLNADFIISNLQEKISIYKIGINRTNPDINIDWIDKQFASTMRYYTRDSKAGLISVLKVSMWMMRHCKEIRKYSILSTIIYWFRYQFFLFRRKEKSLPTKES